MKLLTLGDYQTRAKSNLPKSTYDFYVGGADDEHAVDRNRRAFGKWCIRPFYLSNVKDVDTRTTLLGVPVRSPIHIAPSAMQQLAHFEGEVATARAASKYGCCMTLSTYATKSVEEVRQAAGDGLLWLQLYVFENRALTAALIQRAIALEYRALVVTIDVPYLGRRLRDLRNDFNLPPHMTLGNFPAGVRSGTQRAVGSLQQEISEASSVHNRTDPSLTWDTLVPWIRSLMPPGMKLVVKGVMTAEDARQACNWGVDAVWVSNHGGRQLDTTLSAIEVLQEVVQAVQGRAEVYVDGGVRKGSDVFKALAMGAQAVFLGRPALWGLACGGSDGVLGVLNTLQTEFELAMALSGCSALFAIHSGQITPISRL
jgi:(S)-2-hydroxy-acid oxidase